MTVEKPKLYYGSTGKQVFKILRILLLYIHWREKKKKKLNCKLLIFLPLCRLRCVLVIGSAKTLQFHAPYVPLKLFVKYLW